MTGSRTVSNVYYLPVPAATSSFDEIDPRPTWRARMAHTVWRVRFIMAEIRHILSVPVPSVIPDTAYLGQRGELAARLTRPDTPARIIDFDAARLRLRSM